MLSLPVEVMVALITLSGVILSTIVTGLISYKIGAKNARTAEREASAEAQRAVNEAFMALVKQLQEERRELRSEISSLKQDVQLIGSHVIRLEKALLDNGHPVPPRPIRVKTPPQQ